MHEALKGFFREGQVAPLLKSQYLEDIESFIDWFERTYPTPFSFEKIDQGVIDSYRSTLRFQRKSDQITSSRKLKALRTYLTWAWETGKLSFKPKAPDRWDASKGAQVEHIALEEIGKLLHTLETDYTHAKRVSAQRRASLKWALVVVMLYACLKAREVAELSISDVQIENDVAKITIKGSRYKKRRTAYIPKEGLPALRAWLSVRPSVEYSSLLFISNRNRGLHPELVRTKVKEIGKQLDLILTPHILSLTCDRNQWC